MGTVGDWTLVLPRRRGHDPKSETPSTGEDHMPLPWTPTSSSPCCPTSVAALLDKIHRSIARLEGSAFHRRFLHQVHRHPTLRPRLSSLLHSSPHLVVYGIGSVDAREPPRLQLALALLLHRELNFPHPMEIFDPVISGLECRVMERLGCRVMEVDEGGRRGVESPTLFYMPHCEVTMYDGLLEANWSAEGLERMVVLGNSFREYESYVSGMGMGSRVDREAKFVVKANQIVEEVRIDWVEEEEEEEEEEEDLAVVKADEDDGLFRAFNLTSWHLFRVGDKAEELGLLERSSNNAVV